MNLVFGLQLAMARIGSTVNMNVMVPLYNKCQEFMTLGPHTLGMALLIAASTTVYSFLCSTGRLEKRHNNSSSSSNSNGTYGVNL